MIFTLAKRLWMAFALMALLTLVSIFVGWYNLRVLTQSAQTNTLALIPTMNMARQLSEASAWELFTAQNLNNTDSAEMWQSQGRTLSAQKLKIDTLLQGLREKGFETIAIERQAYEIDHSLRQQGDLVDQRLKLHDQQQQLSQQIVAAAGEIANIAQSQTHYIAIATASPHHRSLARKVCLATIITGRRRAPSNSGLLAIVSTSGRCTKCALALCKYSISL